MRSTKTILALSLILVIVAMALSSAVVFAAGKPAGNTPHPCVVTVGDRVGDSILSDGLGSYTNSTTSEARLWDMVNGVADHLLFQVDQRKHGRNVKLAIPTLIDNLTCFAATFKPNQNDSDYQFYNQLPIGASTDEPDPLDPDRSNFGGTINCLDARGRNGWLLNYQVQCIVIAHTGAGQWTVTADSGCLASVSQVTNGAITPLGNYDVPFQLQATELP